MTPKRQPFSDVCANCGLKQRRVQKYLHDGREYSDVFCAACGVNWGYKIKPVPEAKEQAK